MNALLAPQDIFPLESAFLSEDGLPLELPPHSEARPVETLAGIRLDHASVDSFNRQLHCVDERAPSVEADQLAGLVHWLRELPADLAAATIDLRMERIDLLERMLQDADWDVPPELAQRARRLLDYVNGFHDLIPDEMPLVGHLDDALMVELSWNEFAGEAQDYRDFCRFRHQHYIRGAGRERRAAWERACREEVSVLARRHELRETHYAPTPPTGWSMFRVC